MVLTHHSDDDEEEEKEDQVDQGDGLICIKRQHFTDTTILTIP